ncbi:MAG: hypothetical protein M3126_11660 [Candidatus Eremiobacteraeota bacterium]|nr:hypothetical protein [Candidatus Eremiobacteraeota bacterium]
MNGTRVFRLAAIFASLLGPAGFVVASAQTPPPSSAPGGSTMVQSLTASFADTPRSRYRVVASRSPVGQPPEEQWTLSVSAQNGSDEYHPLYESPAGPDPFHLVPKLERGANTARFFPHETVRIIGAGQLMGEARDQVLVLVHAEAADCGSSTLSVISTQSGAGPVEVPVQVNNPCNLTATIEHHTIVLRGPYYNKNAPLYKPTMNKAVATLRYENNAWVEKPAYFALKYPRLPAPVVTPLTKPSPLFTPIFKAILTTPQPSGAPPPPPGRRG